MASESQNKVPAKLGLCHNNAHDYTSKYSLNGSLWLALKCYRARSIQVAKSFLKQAATLI